MVSIVIRTLIIYLVLLISLRIMGKRQLGELDASELVSALLISELASIPIDDPDIPLLNAIIPILLIFSMEIILSTIKNKSEFLKRTIEGKPAYIIYKGRILQNALIENRLSVNELLSELRLQGVGDIGMVNFAILEQNGGLSVLKKGDGDIAYSVVIDGTIIRETLNSLNYDENWLTGQLDCRGITLSEIFLMTVTDGGVIQIVKKE